MRCQKGERKRGRVGRDMCRHSVENLVKISLVLKMATLKSFSFYCHKMRFPMSVIKGLTLEAIEVL